MPLVATVAAWAADEPSFILVLKDHQFIPAQLTVPSGNRVELVIENRDPTPAEFESTDLRREKIVVGNGRILVWVGPLPVGTYVFFDDFHPATQGKLTAQ
ncbi:MAG: cupredoxin domain-containing protein [Alphaproteobacteria bacterium]|nr:cupredoxin domain-containing protein [Alphaproteobacteria bacterium]